MPKDNDGNLVAILSAGAPFHGKNIRTQFQYVSDKHRWGWEIDFLEWRKDGYESYDLSVYAWCIWIGCFERVFEFMGGIEGPKHIALWIGTDILQHQELIAKGYPDPFQAASIHLADAPHLCQEASELTGLPLGYLRSIPQYQFEPKPIDRWDSVLTYIPQGRDDFFHYPWIREIAADYQDLTFHILSRQEDKRIGNIVEHAHIDGDARNQLYSDCFAILRPCVHDGVSLTLIEMAQLGRYFIHSDLRIPFALPGRTVGEIEFHLDRLLTKKSQQDNSTIDYYRHEYSMDALEGDIVKLKEHMEKMKQ